MTMAAKTKQTKGGPEDEEKDEDEEESNDDKGSEDPDSDADSGGSLEGRIREVVKEVVDGLLGDRTKAAGKSSPAQDEASVFKMVQDAQAKLKKEEDRDRKVSEVSETVETLKKQAEKAPARAGVGGKLQHWFWGEE